MSLETTPLTEMLGLYRSLPKGLTEMKALADRWKAHPGELGERFVLSVAQFSRYRNVEQSFNDVPPDFDSTRHGIEIKRGVDLAKRIADAGRCDVTGLPGFAFTYVSRELDCIRTELGQDLEDGKPSKRAIVLDLLLRHKDGTPILAEVKVKEDANAVYALVQVLAAAAHLVTASQRARLKRQYEDFTFNDTGPYADVAVFFFAGGERKGLRVELLEDAKAIASAALTFPELSILIREIRFVDVALENDGLTFALL